MRQKLQKFQLLEDNIYFICKLVKFSLKAQNIMKSGRISKKQLEPLSSYKLLLLILPAKYPVHGPNPEAARPLPRQVGANREKCLRTWTADRLLRLSCVCVHMCISISAVQNWLMSFIGYQTELLFQDWSCWFGSVGNRMCRWDLPSEMQQSTARSATPLSSL